VSTDAPTIDDATEIQKHKANRTPSEAKERVQLQLTPEAAEKLRLLREATQASTNAEVFRKGLHMYEWILNKLRQGYRIRLVKGDEEKDVEFLL